MVYFTARPWLDIAGSGYWEWWCKTTYRQKPAEQLQKTWSNSHMWHPFFTLEKRTPTGAMCQLTRHFHVWEDGDTVFLRFLGGFAWWQASACVPFANWCWRPGCWNLRSGYPALLGPGAWEHYCGYLFTFLASVWCLCDWSVKFTCGRWQKNSFGYDQKWVAAALYQNEETERA